MIHIFKKNKYQSYELGLIRFIYDIKTSSIIIPFYKDNNLNIISFIKYNRLIKMLSILFKFISVE